MFNVDLPPNEPMRKSEISRDCTSCKAQIKEELEKLGMALNSTDCLKWQRFWKQEGVEGGEIRW